jgi:glyoxalase family protein
MENRILGLHHITAIASDANANLDFYTRILGLRLVKKTVNFDDPGTYHFYYGDGIGTPGSILTFFPWANVRRGSNGNGMATNIGYSVPTGSLSFWQDRFKANGVRHGEPVEKFGELVLPFEDQDGLKMSLIVPATNDERTGWTTGDVTDQVATKGFHQVTLSLEQAGPTAEVLTDIFGYSLQKSEGKTQRYTTDAVSGASIVDLQESPGQAPGRNAAGTNHHVAFRVKNEDILMEFREKVASKGLHITHKIDRDYFFSLYFREPGGVLFEIATDNPGFARDEKVEELGTGLKLPKQYESSREQIEKILPALN